MKKRVINKFTSNKQQSPSQGNSSSIRFKRKKIKSNIKFGGKIILFLILAGTSGALFSNVMLNIKYGDIIYQTKIIERNNNMTINDYGKMINSISSSLVTVSGDEKDLVQDSYYEGNATGIILDKSGSVLTSYSKIKGVKQIYVKLSSKGIMPVKAKFIVGDESTDIAIIRMEYCGDLKPIEIANMDTIEEGQEIAVLSNSIGDEHIGNIVPGVVTSMKASIKYEDDNNTYGLIQVNAPINKENNGGAVCNSKGQLLGIASEKISTEKSLNGLFYAINVNELERIISSADIFKSVLGITGGIIPENTNDIKGFYVENVIKGRTAYNSGIKPTDIIFKVDDRDIKSLDDVSSVLQNKKNGDILKCKVKRNDQINEINIVLK